MPHHRSAKKKLRHDIKRREINRKNKSKLRTQVKKFRKALAEKDVDTLHQNLERTLSVIDKSIQKGVIHKNTASRLKSRLTKQYNSITAETSGSKSE